MCYTINVIKVFLDLLISFFNGILTINIIGTSRKTEVLG